MLHLLDLFVCSKELRLVAIMLISIMRLVSSFLSHVRSAISNDRSVSLMVVQLVVEERFFLLRELALGRFLALIPDEFFKLLHPHLLDLDNLLSFSVYSVVGIELFLELDDGLVPLV